MRYSLSKYALIVFANLFEDRFNQQFGSFHEVGCGSGCSLKMKGIVNVYHHYKIRKKYTLIICQRLEYGLRRNTLSNYDYTQN